ncbi:hypothetical protein KSF78_0004252 [Schistosoma japonicum]|nr:hypothetical protein KSF78_0004252 [Schistosoma japonicum]
MSTVDLSTWKYKSNASCKQIIVLRMKAGTVPIKKCKFISILLKIFDVNYFVQEIFSFIHVYLLWELSYFHFLRGKGDEQVLIYDAFGDQSHNNYTILLITNGFTFLLESDYTTDNFIS